jgi:signal transduction histidine kinase
MRLSLIRRPLKDSPKDAELDDQLGEFSALLEESTSRLRHLIFQLRPPSLDREGLNAAFREYLEQWTGEANLKYAFTSDLAKAPPIDLSAILFRIGQEALTNVRKHSDASTVTVSLKDTGEGVLLRIADDGVGIADKAMLPTAVGHLGMVSMAERAELAGGWFKVDGNGPGTVVEAWIPVTTAA